MGAYAAARGAVEAPPGAAVLADPEGGVEGRVGRGARLPLVGEDLPAQLVRLGVARRVPELLQLEPVERARRRRQRLRPAVYRRRVLLAPAGVLARVDLGRRRRALGRLRTRVEPGDVGGAADDEEAHDREAAHGTADGPVGQFAVVAAVTNALSWRSKA